MKNIFKKKEKKKILLKFLITQPNKRREKMILIAKLTNFAIKIHE